MAGACFWLKNGVWMRLFGFYRACASCAGWLQFFALAIYEHKWVKKTWKCLRFMSKYNGISRCNNNAFHDKLSSQEFSVGFLG